MYEPEDRDSHEIDRAHAVGRGGAPRGVVRRDRAGPAPVRPDRGWTRSRCRCGGICWSRGRGGTWSTRSPPIWSARRWPGHRAEVTPVIREWATDDDLWLRRTAVICQLALRRRDRPGPAAPRDRQQHRRHLVLAAQGDRLGAASVRAGPIPVGARRGGAVRRPDVRAVTSRGDQAPRWRVAGRIWVKVVAQCSTSRKDNPVSASRGRLAIAAATALGVGVALMGPIAPTQSAEPRPIAASIGPRSWTRTARTLRKAVKPERIFRHLR